MFDGFLRFVARKPKGVFTLVTKSKDNENDSSKKNFKAFLKSFWLPYMV